MTEIIRFLPFFYHTVGYNLMHNLIMLIPVNARAMHNAIHMSFCHLANRLVLAVREEERNITHYIMDFLKLYNHL